MRVLAVSQSAELGGGARSFLDLIVRLPQAGIDVEVVVPGDGPMRPLLEKVGIASHVQPHKTWLEVKPSRWKALGRWWFNRRAAARLETLARSFDLVYTNSIWGPMGAMLADRADRPHVWHFRELVSTTPGRRFAMGEAFSRAFLDRTTIFAVGNSRFIADRALEYVPRAKMRCSLTAPLSLADYRPDAPPHPGIEPGRPLRLIIVGTVQERKGQADALRAVSELERRGIEATLKIVGGGGDNYRAKMRTLADDLGVSGRVEWIRRSDDVPGLFRNSDLALTCSVEDPIPRTTIEAMSVGCLPIGTESGGVPEIIDRGETGWLYPPADVVALVDRIEAAARLGDAYRSWSEEARRRVFHRFDVARHVQEMVELFREAAGTGARTKNV